MNKEKQIPPLTTYTASELMKMEFDPLVYSIDKLLPEGVFILAGSGKIGKSWLALDMCIATATDGKLWDYKATDGEVLYLALEDTYRRLKGRLELIQEENVDIDKLHLAIASLGITDGLIEQVKGFMKAKPNTRLIVIDTLERIRNTEQDKSIYSCDYRDISTLREITKDSTVTLLLIHHTRKMYDPDPLNTLSGSTGLVGAVDGVWVLEKESRTENKGKLTIANRDTGGYCFKVEFDKDKFKWNSLGSFDTAKEKENIDFCVMINDFLQTKWQGTATDLAKELTEATLSSSAITKRLNKSKDRLFADFGIRYSNDRTRDKRTITLFREVIVTDDTASIDTPSDE